MNSYNHDNLTLQFKMDNELELIYVVSSVNVGRERYTYIIKILEEEVVTSCEMIVFQIKPSHHF